MNDFKLGQPVVMAGTARKTHIGNRTTYERAPLPIIGGVGGHKTYSGGIIVGKRTLLTGKTEYYYASDEAPCFFPDGSVTVWIVAFDLHRKPAICFRDQITAELAIT